MEKLVESSKNFVSRVRAGEVTSSEVLQRLYTATLYVLAVAYVLSLAIARAAVLYTPAVLTTLKKTFAYLSDAIPSGNDQADRQAEERL